MASKKAFEARQKTWARYVASVGPEVAARDAGVSQSTMRDFLQTNPTKKASEKKIFQSLITSRPTVVAKEHDRKLIHSLSKTEYERLTTKHTNLPQKSITRIRVTRVTRRAPTEETRQYLRQQRANRYIISEGLAQTPSEQFSPYTKSRLAAAYGKTKK